ncbi:hypothetical protein ACMF2R_001861, partial [Campylobacter coli]|nr:hypothetical protein [Campylobacter jejuni]EDP3100251.1 hypothetical protein [Campylobacter jejuni]
MSKIKQGAFQILSIEIKKFNFEQNQEIQESDINGIKFNNTIGAIAQRRNVQKKDSFLIQLNLDIQANNN